MDLAAVCQRVLQAQLQKAGLGARDALEEGQQGDRLLTLVPAFEPASKDAHLVPEHHGGWNVGLGSNSSQTVGGGKGQGKCGATPSLTWFQF